MTGYLLVLLFSLFHLGESIIVKTYAKKHQSGGMLMNAIISLFACAFFAVTDKGGFYFPLGMLPLAFINVVLYAFGFYFAFIAFKIGPFGLTKLISNFALMFSIFYGIIFLNEPTSVWTYIAIAMIVFAMLMINQVKKKDDDDDNSGKVSVKWVICILIATVSNGFIAILTRMQQIRFDNACSNEFQMISTGGAFLALAIFGFITDRGNIKYTLRHGLPYGVFAGVLNGAKNFIMIAVYLFLPISTASPMKTGLGMVLSFLISIFFYKEKYSVRQIIGVILGATAVVLLAL